jgi:hypothetical protein
MLRSVRLADPILDLLLTIILILRHLSPSPRCDGWQGTLRQSQTFDERFCHRLLFAACAK